MNTEVSGVQERKREVEAVRGLIESSTDGLNTVVTFFDANQYYDVLGVNPHSRDEEIKKRYRKISTQFAADKLQMSFGEYRKRYPELTQEIDALLKLATRTQQCINAAYEILSNPRERSKYDERRSGSMQDRPVQGSEPAQQSGRQATNPFNLQNFFSFMAPGVDFSGGFTGSLTTRRQSVRTPTSEERRQQKDQDAQKAIEEREQAFVVLERNILHATDLAGAVELLRLVHPKHFYFPFNGGVTIRDLYFQLLSVDAMLEFRTEGQLDEIIDELPHTEAGALTEVGLHIADLIKKEWKKIHL